MHLRGSYQAASSASAGARARRAGSPRAVRVRAHPYFEDYANRLPYMEAPPGREFIVVIDDGIFKQVVAEAEALRIQQTKRLLRPADPRNLPFIQVEPVLIGGAVVAAFVATFALHVYSVWRWLPEDFLRLRITPSRCQKQERRYPCYLESRIRKTSSGTQECNFGATRRRVSRLRRLNRQVSCTAMPSTESAIQLLFSYGTLQLESVQLATFGRRLAGAADGLPGFEESLVKIEDASVVASSGKTHHPIVRFTGRESDIVYGTAFKVTAEELRNADTYEVSAYKRISATLLSGVRAWVYVDAR